ncbi:zinc finger BED domain-containing protein 5 [Trichonephila clavipes]|nr:zinc finger BED domain-containing protein 5 [Trichonephila clavipes]
MEASYKVYYRIALEDKAHVIGESLIKHCVQDIVFCVLGERYSKQVESLSLSNNTVTRRIADDIEIELIPCLQACNAYVLQLDESTNVAGLEILLVFVRNGAKAMTGKVSDAVAQIKNVAKNCNSTHCILHRYA